MITGPTRENIDLKKVIEEILQNKIEIFNKNSKLNQNSKKSIIGGGGGLQSKKQNAIANFKFGTGFFFFRFFFFFFFSVFQFWQILTGLTGSFKVVHDCYNSFYEPFAELYRH